MFSSHREMMIVFVYDTECCQDEADDPVKAVLYFYPSWVSDVQKISLCGQLMGTTHFLCETFAARPKVIALQSGKFVLREFGRFILAIGTDRNLSNSILEHRANLLTSLVAFFHRDIQTMHDQFIAGDQTDGGGGGGTYKSLSEKLYHIFETYLPILQYNGNIFQNMPISRLPKSASNIFLDAMHTLQSCQQTKGILGGAILFHNKVLATQLSPELTKNLVLTDPYRIKSTAESVSVQFHIPVGVQLQIVYIPMQEHRALSADSQRAQTVMTNPSASAMPTIPFQFKKKMKRDKSIIFTNIPEESATNDADPNASFGEIAFGTEALLVTNTVTTKPIAPRPTHLPLRFKNITSKDLPESGFSSINFDETDSFPQFIGRTSVCSTPMTEMKVLHGAVLSICANNEQPAIAAENNKKSPKESSTKENRHHKQTTSLNFITNPFRSSNEQRRHSLTSLQDSLKKIRITMRPFGHGLTRLSRPTSPADSCSVPQFDGEFDDVERKMYRTITDPTYPVFNSAGEPISKCLFQEFLNRHHAESPDMVDDVDDFDSEMKTSPIHEQKRVEHPPCLPTPSALNRIALSLPLKSLTTDAAAAAAAANTSTINIFEVPAHRKKMAGIQLTPLMTKLSVLAMSEERSSGFSSWDTTPGAVAPSNEMGIPSDTTKSFRRRSSVKIDDIAEMTASNGERTRCQLFICGQQNMTMLLLMENGAGEKQEVIQAMVCVYNIILLLFYLYLFFRKIYI